MTGCYSIENCINHVLQNRCSGFKNSIHGMKRLGPTIIDLDASEDETIVLQTIPTSSSKEQDEAAVTPTIRPAVHVKAQKRTNQSSNISSSLEVSSCFTENKKRNDTYGHITSGPSSFKIDPQITNDQCSRTECSGKPILIPEDHERTDVVRMSVGGADEGRLEYEKLGPHLANSHTPPESKTSSRILTGLSNLNTNSHIVLSDALVSKLSREQHHEPPRPKGPVGLSGLSSSKRGVQSVLPDFTEGSASRELCSEPARLGTNQLKPTDVHQTHEHSQVVSATTDAWIRQERQIELYKQLIHGEFYQDTGAKTMLMSYDRFDFRFTSKLDSSMLKSLDSQKANPILAQSDEITWLAGEVLLGYWADSPIQDEVLKHAVTGFVDKRGYVDYKIQALTRAGKEISAPFSKWAAFDRIVLQTHLRGYHRDFLREYVKSLSAGVLTGVVTGGKVATRNSSEYSRSSTSKRQKLDQPSQQLPPGYPHRFLIAQNASDFFNREIPFEFSYNVCNRERVVLTNSSDVRQRTCKSRKGRYQPINTSNINSVTYVCGHCHSDFPRKSDLERHWKPNDCLCDYKKCPVASQTRRDHLRTHYRDYHKEDVARWRGRSRIDESWRFWTERRPSESWWRCRCLQRIAIDVERCSECKEDRGETRQVFRRAGNVDKQNFKDLEVLPW